ncbi:MAG TPA: cytochrome C6 [Cyanobacteria bacterium UBA11149]|nr:cytochrome C6 [Cyanobacteria bacterium UBA11367]HBE58968.1 cytochrome C6 [Cyanobacteria bacterium UBA11366]HBK65884.1 cytochrome C6 [Cyanobacteria bacterium UBA11166]HBR72274.1 cytochrome C6 [Cyanobacteria bacterium UBA11159]HBS68816.1 cytochrome C6 [Cyanobacteria bacterium UBA11153]HBW91049.1 cytochrome C6 [Cyanobacteria bacterium UBA11149]HCA98106.1 cytochrome C6 [Cyanobacteria bacterium UBA9226]
MKKILSIVLLAVACFGLLMSRPASANVASPDPANGAKLFSANCIACHAGGNNLVIAPKTLKKADLEKYGMFSAEAIITQVTNGKGPMPSFRRLGADNIADVAAFVLAQADKW